MTTTVEKSVKNYVEWYFQSAQRLNFSQLYAGIMIIHCIHCVHCIHWFHTLDTPLQTQTHTHRRAVVAVAAVVVAVVAVVTAAARGGGGGGRRRFTRRLKFKRCAV